MHDIDNENKINNTYILDKIICYSIYSIRSILQGHHNSNKRLKFSLPLPVVSGILKIENERGNAQNFQILLDSGASQSVIHQNLVQQTECSGNPPISWDTVAGAFTTNKRAEISFKLPTLHEKRVITSKVHVTSQLNNYDMILGRDLLQDLGIVLNFKDNTIVWDDSIIAMQGNVISPDALNNIEESETMYDATSRMKRIIEAKYEAANLNEIAKDCKNLSTVEQNQLEELLQKYSTLFDGTLGHWKDEPYNIELKPDAKPYHARPYPIPKAYEATLKMEVQRLQLKCFKENK
jgi:gag-polyprotein putative aspartyl protease